MCKQTQTLKLALTLQQGTHSDTLIQPVSITSDWTRPSATTEIAEARTAALLMVSAHNFAISVVAEGHVQSDLMKTGFMRTALSRLNSRVMKKLSSQQGGVEVSGISS